MSDIKPLQGSLSLGKVVDYASQYDSGLLCVLDRNESRQRIGIDTHFLPFDGVDIWNAYELSWLDLQGKPVVAYGRFSFPCQSPGMIESKSLKLYLNSLNQSRFQCIDDLRETIARDLAAAVKMPVGIEVFPASAFGEPAHFMGAFTGECIDDLPATIENYHINPGLLQVKGDEISEILYTHLLRTNCPVTGQPDWASLAIRYQGPKINRVSLLQYICSFRLQAEFHEQCVERIFRDLLEHCRCRHLTLEARFLRRGGLDINPFRTNCDEKPQGLRLLRQ